MANFFKKGDSLFGFLKSGRNRNGEIVFRPVLGRILVALTGLAVAGWMAAALAVMIFVQQARDFHGGSYLDIVFPWRWDEYRVAWGEEFIERGLELLKEGEVQEGIHMIRVGHVKSPTNLDGRLIMAELYASGGRTDRAGDLLRGGLPYAEDNIDYLRTTFRVLISTQNDQAVKEIAESILSDEVVLTPRHQVTALAAATAHFHRGGYDQAEDLIANYDLANHPEGRIMLARIDWERGRQQAALDRLQALSNQFTDQEEVYMLLTNYYRELGDHTKAHNYAVMRQISNPLSAAPRIALLYSHHAAGETDRVQQLADQLLRDFGHDSTALINLGEFAANVGDVDLCRRVLQTADKGGFPLDTPAILLSEAHLNAGEFREAVAFLDNFSRQNEDFAERYGPILDGIYAVAYFGLGNNDTGEMHLTRFLNARNLRAENFLIISRRIIELGQVAHARRVVLHAHRADPLNQAALTELIRLDLESRRTDDLVNNIQKLLTMRKPPRALLQESLVRLSGDQFLFLPKRNDLLRSIHETMRGAGDEDSVTHS